jgi:hypothetical protein
MQLAKKIFISDNDIYIMSQSKDFIIINDDYKGIEIYDSDLNYVKSVAINNELMISQIYSTELNNMIVIFDAESEKLFIVNLDKTEDNVVEKSRAEHFLDYFISYDDYFTICDSKNAYDISFEDGKEIARHKCEFVNILAWNQREQLYEINGRVFYGKDSKQKKLSVKYDDKFYSIYDGIILEYNEQEIIVRGLPDSISKISVDDKWEVRKAIIGKNSCIVLLNNRESIYRNKILKYSVDSAPNEQPIR